MNTKKSSYLRHYAFGVAVAIGSVASACAAQQAPDSLSTEERIFVNAYLRLLRQFQSTDLTALTLSCGDQNTRRSQAAACALFTYLLNKKSMPFLESSEAVGRNPESLWNVEVIFSDDDFDGEPDHPGTEFRFSAEFFLALRTVPDESKVRALGLLLALVINSDGVYKAAAWNELALFMDENPRQVVRSWDQYGSSLSDLGFEIVDSHLLRSEFLSDINEICNESSSKCDSAIREFASAVSNRK